MADANPSTSQSKRTQRRSDSMPDGNEGFGELHDYLMSQPRMRFIKRYDRNGNLRYTYYAWDGRSVSDGERIIGKTPEEALEKYRECEAGIIPGKQPRRVSRRQDYGPEYAALPQWAKIMFHNAKARSRAVDREFSLTTAQFVELVTSADGRCQLSGLKLDTSVQEDGRTNPFTPSIDRIDSTKGYVDGNCRIVCLMANLMLKTWGDGPLMAFAEGVVERLSKSQKKSR
jgi:hypothetical protein